MRRAVMLIVGLALIGAAGTSTRRVEFAAAQGPPITAPCEDRLGEARVLLDYYVTSKTRDLAEAARTIATLIRERDALRADLARLREGGGR